jgi:hypothetical protein
MTPYIRLTAVPYAQNAAALNGIAASGFIQNSTNPQTANFNVVSGSSGSVTATIQGASGQSVDIAEIKVNGVANPVFKVASDGSATFQSPTAQGSLTALQVQNSSGTNLLTADTTNMHIGVAVTYTAMSAPTGLVVGSATAGGTLTASAIYKYKVTAIDSAGGETAASSEASGTVGTSGTQTLPVSWTAVAGASGYKLYRTAANGASNSELYIATVLTNSFTDAGAGTLGVNSPPSTANAFTATNNSNSLLQLSIGGLGSATGQVYVSGLTPKATGISTTGLNNPQKIIVQGRYAYIADFTAHKLVVYDVSNPGVPTFITSTSNGLSNPQSLAVAGHYAYIVDRGNLSLVIFDISNPSNLGSPVGSVSTGLASPREVYVQGRYAYVVDDSNNKLSVFDVGSPSKPSLVSSSSTGLSGPMDVYVQGRYAYIASSSNSSLVIYDISNPTSLTEVAATNSGLAGPQHIYVQGRYAYVDTLGQTFNIFDISNPSAPVAVGSTSAGMSAVPSNIYVQGRYAYILEGGNNGLKVYNISNPANPTLIASAATNIVSSRDLYVQGRYAYVTDGAPYLLTYDLGGTYSQQLESGGIETGTLAVNSMLQAASDASIGGGLQIGQSLQVSGNASFAGSTLLQNQSNSSTAFQVLNSSAVSALSVDTTTNTTTITNLNVTGTCTGCGSSTLASSYNLSATTGNTITLAQSGAGIKIQDAPTPITGSDLFDIQSNGGATTYLGVSPANSGTVTVGGRLYTPSLDSTSGTLNIGTGNASTITIGNTSNSNVVIKTAPTSLTNVYNENFDSGGTWTNGGTTNGAYTWSARSQTTAQSGSTYWAYNNGTSDGYDTGGAINYYSDSPAVAISARTNPMLNMYYQLNLAEIGTTFDQAFIEIVDATNPNITRASWPLTTNQLTWTLFSKSLTPSWGSVKIQVRIYTSDGAANTGFGFRLDSVSISDNAPPAFQVQNATGNYLLAVDSQSSNIITSNLAAQSAGTVSLNDSRFISSNVPSATQGTAVALGQDGFARIAYTDSSGYLRYVQCTSANCTTKNDTTVVFASSTYSPSVSMYMGQDGFARIVYYDSSTATTALKFVQCTNVACSTNNINTVDTGSSVGVGYYNSAIMGQDGFARIAYYDYINKDLKFAQCTNAACSTSTITTVDSTGDVGTRPSIALGQDGFARISYYDATNTRIKFAQCTNAACSTNVLTVISSVYASNPYSVVAVASDGFARIVYTGSAGYVQYSRCTAADCSALVTNALSSSIQSKAPSYMTMGFASDGFARISYYTGNYVGAGGYSLYLIQCMDTSCTSSTSSLVDSSNDYDGAQSSMAIGSDDWMNISYYDYNPVTNVYSVKFAHLKTVGILGTSIVSGGSLGTSANPYGQLYAKTLDLGGTLSVNGTGYTTLKPLYDSTSLLQIQNNSGANILTVDSVNNNVNLLAATPIIAAATTISSNSNAVDSSGGWNISSVIASDGNDRIVQIGGAGGGLHYYVCNNSDCSSNTSTTVATFACGTSYQAASVAMAPDGFARIAYEDCPASGPTALKYIQCQNASCSTRATYTVDGTVSIIWPTIVIAPDGFARIAYYDNSDGDLRYAQCNDAACSAPTISTIDSTGNVGEYPAITLGSDGFARIAYEDSTNSALKMAQCTNASCSTNVITSVATAASATGWSTGIAMGSNGYPEISYYYSGTADLKLVVCASASCSTNSTYTVDSTGTVGLYNSMTISGGTAYISYYNSTTGTIKLATVTSGLSISTYTINSASGTGIAYQYSSVTVGSDGKARIAYQDAGTSKLRFTIQGNTIAAVTGSSLGTSTSPFANIYTTNLNSSYFTLQPSSDVTKAFQIKNSSGLSVLNVDTSSASITAGGSVNSSTAFQVQNASGTSLFNIDTSTTTVTFGSVSNGLVLTAGTYEPSLNGSARHQKSISLSAEYPGAVMTPTSSNGHTGSMTSDFDVTNFHNYYDWTSTVAGSDYDIFVRVPIPADFSAWNGVGTVNVWGTVLGDSVTFAVWDTANASVCASSSLISATATWQTVSATTPTTPCNYTASGTYTAGGTMTLRIRLTATNANDHVRVAAINLPYLSKW